MQYALVNLGDDGEGYAVQVSFPKVDENDRAFWKAFWGQWKLDHAKMVEWCVESRSASKLNALHPKFGVYSTFRFRTEKQAAAFHTRFHLTDVTGE